MTPPPHSNESDVLLYCFRLGCFLRWNAFGKSTECQRWSFACLRWETGGLSTNSLLWVDFCGYDQNVFNFLLVIWATSHKKNRRCCWHILDPEKQCKKLFHSSWPLFNPPPTKTNTTYPSTRHTHTLTKIAVQLMNISTVALAENCIQVVVHPALLHLPLFSDSSHTTHISTETAARSSC